jgi:hypothetical protein
VPTTRKQRSAHRPRWRPVPAARRWPPPASERTVPPPDREGQRRSARAQCRVQGLSIPVIGLDLPPLFAPSQAAVILRRLGLTEMTECALRTRAYRRQVPFHMNGRRITFTASDLREIAEGDAQRPKPAPERKPTSIERQTARRSRARDSDDRGETWRARRCWNAPAHRTSA